MRITLIPSQSKLGEFRRQIIGVIQTRRLPLHNRPFVHSLDITPLPEILRIIWLIIKDILDSISCGFTIWFIIVVRIIRLLHLLYLLFKVVHLFLIWIFWTVRIRHHSTIQSRQVISRNKLDIVTLPLRIHPSVELVFLIGFFILLQLRQHLT